MVSYPFRSADMNFRDSLRIAYESNFNGASVIKRSFLSNNLKKIRGNIIRTKRHEFKIATKITLVISLGNCSFGALACSKSVKRFSITFTANGKRQDEISRLPKTREIYLVSAYILPLRHSYGASTKNREIR